jgi:hypothetical protein
MAGASAAAIEFSVSMFQSQRRPACEGRCQCFNVSLFPSAPMISCKGCGRCFSAGLQCFNVSMLQPKTEAALGTSTGQVPPRHTRREPYMPSPFLDPPPVSTGGSWFRPTHTAPRPAGDQMAGHWGGLCKELCQTWIACFLHSAKPFVADVCNVLCTLSTT